MRTISRRLEKLEKIIAPTVEKDDGWGSMAPLREQLLRQAQERGEPFVADMKKQLDAMGPLGLWSELARVHLGDHGFVQQGTESFAETMCRALGIGSSELRVSIQEGRLGRDLVNRFGGAKTATDNG